MLLNRKSDLDKMKDFQNTLYFNIIKNKKDILSFIQNNKISNLDLIVAIIKNFVVSTKNKRITYKALFNLTNLDNEYLSEVINLFLSEDKKTIHHLLNDTFIQTFVLKNTDSFLKVISETTDHNKKDFMTKMHSLAYVKRLNKLSDIFNHKEGVFVNTSNTGHRFDFLIKIPCINPYDKNVETTDSFNKFYAYSSYCNHLLSHLCRKYTFCPIEHVRRYKILIDDKELMKKLCFEITFSVDLDDLNTNSYGEIYLFYKDILDIINIFVKFNKRIEYSFSKNIKIKKESLFPEPYLTLYDTKRNHKIFIPYESKEYHTLLRKEQHLR